MAHTLARLMIHAVFSTKERRPFLDTDVRRELFPYLGSVISRLKGKPILINGSRDHVHLLFLLPPSLPLSDIMEKLKANSSKWVHERWPNRPRFGWQEGYAAFSVSESNVEEVRLYIAKQDEHHRERTFQEELLAFLKKHRVEYDPRFVFA